MAQPAAVAWALLVFLAVSPAGSASRRSDWTPRTQCILDGMWINDLGSKMNIYDVDMLNGEFSGTYLTAVSDTLNPIIKSPLLGSQQLPNVNQLLQPTFGFVVRWGFSESVTGFVGQCFVDGNDTETLETMWLMRKPAASFADDWEQTLVGTDVFRRIK